MCLERKYSVDPTIQKLNGTLKSLKGMKNNAGGPVKSKIELQIGATKKAISDRKVEIDNEEKKAKVEEKPPYVNHSTKNQQSVGLGRLGR